MSGPRTVRAPRGTQLTCKSWLSEAAYRMIQNNLDPEVAEKPENLVVYGGRGQAARNWDCFDAILESLKNLEDDETLLVQSGKPVGVVRTHADAPRVLIANSNLVGCWTGSSAGFAPRRIRSMACWCSAFRWLGSRRRRLSWRRSRLASPCSGPWSSRARPSGWARASSRRRSTA